MNRATDLADLEADLRRRLTDLAATTTVDPNAWTTITERATSAPARRRPTRRQLAAIAAAVALIIGLLTLTGDSDDRTETVDDTTTTTTNTHPTSTASSSTSTTTRSGAPPGNDPRQPTTPNRGNAPGPGATTSGTESGQPQAGDPETGTGSPAPTGGPPTSSTTAPPDTAPDGYPITATFPRDGYTVDVTAYESGSDISMNLWRDASQYLINSTWPRGCLAGQVATYNEGELGRLNWGYVRADAATVEIVTTSGNRTAAVMGSTLASGLRPWIGLRPAGQVDRFEARDARGAILYTATGPVWQASGPC